MNDHPERQGELAWKRSGRYRGRWLTSMTGLRQHGLAQRLSAVVHDAPGAADPHVLSATAGLPGAVVVSNDRYRECRAAYPWLSTRRVTFMLIAGNARVLICENATPLAPATAIGQPTQ
jgi:hypothetical protein